MNMNCYFDIKRAGNCKFNIKHNIKWSLPTVIITYTYMRKKYLM